MFLLPIALVTCMYLSQSNSFQGFNFNAYFVSDHMVVLEVK